MESLPPLYRIIGLKLSGNCKYNDEIKFDLEDAYCLLSRKSQSAAPSLLFAVIIELPSNG